LENNQAGDENRRGMIWFVFNRRLLADEGGMNRFFRYWGGESLYRRHSLDAATAACLERVGVPCIVEAAIPVRAIASSFTQIPARMLSVYLKHRQVQASLRDDAEGYVREAVTSERVRRVIQLPDADFTSLTACERWDVMPS
jgi:hypothetical protein